MKFTTKLKVFLTWKLIKNIKFNQISNFYRVFYWCLSSNLRYSDKEYTTPTRVRMYYVYPFLPITVQAIERAWGPFLELYRVGRGGYIIHTYDCGLVYAARNAIDKSDFFIPVTEPKITFFVGITGSSLWELRYESYAMRAMLWELCYESYAMRAMLWELCYEWLCYEIDIILSKKRPK